MISFLGPWDVHRVSKSDGVRAVSWLLDIRWCIFCAIFDLARQTKLRDGSEPRWFHCSLAMSDCVLATLIIVSVLVSWKITVIAAGLFIVSLTAGAVTETEDWGVR